MLKKDRKPLFLGWLMCAGVLGFLAITVFFPKAHGDGKQEIHVAFPVAGGAERGMNVCLAGRVIGSVAAIHNIIDEEKEDPKGQLCCYKLVLKIDSNIPIYKGDVIAMYSPKLIGEPIVNIFPSKSRKDSERISSQDIVFGQNIDPLDKLMHCLDKADKAVSALKDEVHEVSLKISHVLGAHKELPVMSHVQRAAESIENCASRFSECLNASRIEKIDKFLNECHDVAFTVRNYGLLYQYSQKWKRRQKHLEAQSLEASQEK